MNNPFLEATPVQNQTDKALLRGEVEIDLTKINVALESLKRAIRFLTTWRLILLQGDIHFQCSMENNVSILSASRLLTLDLNYLIVNRRCKLQRRSYWLISSQRNYLLRRHYTISIIVRTMSVQTTYKLRSEPLLHWVYDYIQALLFVYSTLRTAWLLNIGRKVYCGQ